MKPLPNEDDHFYPEPDWDALCDAEISGYDDHDRYREGRCGLDAEHNCCGQQFCDRHYDEHRETCPKADCVWCNGTGVYSGPMLARWYAGPCQFCQEPTM